MSYINTLCKDVHLTYGLCYQRISNNKILSLIVTYLGSSINSFSCFTSKYLYLILCVRSIYKGNVPSNFNQLKCIKYQNHNTPVYWRCERLASHVPMQPTNKHLRISYVLKVNSNMTHLLSMSHTLNPFQMHCSILTYNTNCNRTYGCSNLILGHDWVTRTRIFLLVISPCVPLLSHIYYPNTCTQSKPHLSLAWM